VRRLLAVVGGLVFVVAAASPAHAGGALLDFDREFYVPGDVVHASSGVWLESAQGRLEDGPYFAYLSRYRGLDDMPPPLPEDAVRVATADVRPRPADHTYGDVTIEFVLPDVEPGRYWVTTCNEGCRLTLGDVMPTIMTVAADDAEGRIVTATERLSHRIRALRIMLSNRVFGHRADSLRNRITALERDVARLEGETVELNAAVERLSRPVPEEGSSALGPVLAFVIPAAVAGAVVGRRSRAG
jgi:hypothetical protein